MYQTIHENIAVLGVYNRSNFVPKKFKWNDKSIKIDSINLQSDIKDGGVRYRYYSVSDTHGTVYRLSFNRETEEWLLAELWVD